MAYDPCEGFPKQLPQDAEQQSKTPSCSNCESVFKLLNFGLSAALQTVEEIQATAAQYEYLANKLMQFAGATIENGPTTLLNEAITAIDKTFPKIPSVGEIISCSMVNCVVPGNLQPEAIRAALVEYGRKYLNDMVKKNIENVQKTAMGKLAILQQATNLATSTVNSAIHSQDALMGNFRSILDCIRANCPQEAAANPEFTNFGILDTLGKPAVIADQAFMEAIDTVNNTLECIKLQSSWAVHDFIF